MEDIIKQNPLLKEYFKDMSFDDLLNPVNHDIPETVKKIITFSEDMMKKYAQKITYTQIRNILQTVKDDDFKNNIALFYKVIPKLAYMEARPQKDTEGKALIAFIRELANQVSSQKQYLLFMDIMNTIVAYHKLYGKKQK